MDHFASFVIVAIIIIIIIIILDDNNDCMLFVGACAHICCTQMYSMIYWAASALSICLYDILHKYIYVQYTKLFTYFRNALSKVVLICQPTSQPVNWPTEFLCHCYPVIGLIILQEIVCVYITYIFIYIYIYLCVCLSQQQTLVKSLCC